MSLSSFKRIGCLLVFTLSLHASYGNSIDSLLHSWRLGVSQNEKLQAATSLSYLYAQDGMTAQALQFGKEALRIAGAIKDTPVLISVNENICIAYLKGVVVPDQLQHYNHQMIDLSTAYHDTTALAKAFKIAGILYLHRLESALNGKQSVEPYKDSAIHYFQKSSNLYMKINHSIGAATCLGKIGDAYNLVGNTSKAKGYYEKYYQVAFESNDWHSKMTASIQLAGCYFEMDIKDSFQKSIQYYTTGLKLAKETNSLYEQTHCLDFISHAYEELGDFRKSLQYRKEFITSKESFINQNQLVQLDELHVKYESEKKGLQINLLSANNKLQKHQLYLLFAGFIATLIFLVVLFLQNKHLKASRVKIARQTEDLKLMMRELHHRVKNNLAIVSSLLKIQSSRLEDQDAIHAVLQGQQRVEAMSLIHQRLYQSEKVSYINIKHFFVDLVAELCKAHAITSNNISIDIHVEQEEVDVDLAMPLGLITNEILTNSFKYALSKVRHPVLRIELLRKNGLTFVIHDNGEDFDELLWENSNNSFGKKLVQGLSKQISANYSITDQKGMYFCLNIPTYKS